MTYTQMTKAVARWIALGALFLVPLVPLIVVNSFFFPFITGKAFFFRIVVEIAIGAWAVLAFLDREYRPRFSWIGVAVLAFIAWMFVADLFAVNAAKAFWSNFERMEGWVLLIHLLGFFVAASAVLRVEKKWRAWFLASLGVAVVVSAHGILQQLGALPIHQGSTRIDSSFGNSAYFAVYLLFNTFLALWLALSEKRQWLKWTLIAFAVVEASLIFFTETRGTILGLLIALGIAALLTLFTAGKRARQVAGWGLALLLLVSGGFYLARGSSFVQDNHVLQRIASISLADGATRFTIWHMAFEGVAARPITGWGQEGFNYVFNTYYDPSLYGQEQWFDRAHDAFIDWLVQGGVPAFVLYLAIWGSVLWYLWRRSELSRSERILLTAALAGYAVHNLFVFDNLYAYVYFFAILALVDSQVARPIRRLDTAPEPTDAGVTASIGAVAAVAVIAAIWAVNVPGMRVASDLITAMTPSPGGVAENLSEFKALSAHPSFAGQEVREQLVSFAVAVAQSQAVSDADKKAALDLAISEMRKQVAAYPLDAREHLELSYAYRSAGDATDALKEVRTAIMLSPKKEVSWLEAGTLDLALGNVAAAQQDFDTAYQLGPQFKELATYAAAGDIFAADTAKADQVLQDAYGTTTVDSDILAAAYYQTKQWDKLIALLRLRASNPSLSATDRASIQALITEVEKEAK